MKHCLKTAPLIGMVTLSVLETDLYLASFPSIARYFSVSELLVQSSFTLYLLVFSLGILLIGPLSNFIGRKKTILSALFIDILGTLLIVFSPSITLFLIGRVLQAIGGASGTILGRILGRELFNGEKSKSVLAYLLTGVSIALMISPTLGGYLEGRFHWKALFLFLLLFQGILWIMIRYFIPEIPSSSEKIFSQLKCDAKEVFQQPAFRRYCALSTCAWSGFFAFVTGSPFFMINQLNLDPTQFGALFALIMMGMGIGTFLFGHYLAKWEVKPTLSLGMGIMIFASFFLLIDSSWYFISFAMFGYQLGIGILLPLCQVELTQENSPINSMVFSLLYFFQMLGATLAGFFLSLLSTIWPSILPYFIFIFTLGSFTIFTKIYLSQFSKPNKRIQ